MRFKKAVYVLLSLSAIFISCDESDRILPPSDVEYFPLQVGMTWVYEVEETLNEQGIESTSLYNLKLSVTDSFISQTSEIVFVITRSKSSQGAVWTTLDTWSSRANSIEGVIREGNVDFIKMAFPLSEGKAWDGNAYNSLGGAESCGPEGRSCDVYAITDYASPYILSISSGSVTYDDVIVIEQSNNADLIVAQDIRSEVYARNVGLIYKESVQIKYCTIGSCLGQQVIEKGSWYYQRLIQHGS